MRVEKRTIGLVIAVALLLAGIGASVSAGVSLAAPLFQRPTPTNVPPPEPTSPPPEPTATPEPSRPTATSPPPPPTATSAPSEPTATSAPPEPTATSAPLEPTATPRPPSPPSGSKSPKPTQPPASVPHTGLGWVGWLPAGGVGVVLVAVLVVVRLLRARFLGKGEG